MARTIGSVDFIVSLDGTVIPPQAAALGAMAGRIAAAAFDKAYGKQMKALGAGMRKRFEQLGIDAGGGLGDGISAGLGPSLQRIQKQLSSSFSGNSLDRFGESVRNSTVDIGELIQTYDDLEDSTNNAGNGFVFIRKAALEAGGEAEGATLRFRGLGEVLRDFFSKNGTAAKEWSAEQLAAFEKNRATIGGFTKEVDKADGSSKRFFRTWKELPHGFRQAALYTGLFASLGSAISILGSVAGSSLAVLGTTLFAVGAGAGVAIAGFQNLMGPMEALGPNAQNAATGLRAIGDAFSALQGGIQESLFAAIGNSFERVAAMAPLLQGSLNGVAGSVGGVFAALATALSSSRGVEVLNQLLVGSQDIITALGDVVINFGSALGTIFVAAIGPAQEFTRGLADLGARFSTFLQSAEGQTALADFFGTLASVMPHILELVGATGKALAGLVTPETIGLFNNALDQLSGFMPALSGILGVIAVLDPLGIVATLLNQIGEAITPLLPQLMDLGRSISDVLLNAVVTLAPSIGVLLAALVPLAAAIVDQLGPAFEQILPILTQFIEDAMPALIEAFTAAIPLIGPVADLLATLLPPILEALIPALDTAATNIALLSAAIAFLLTPVEDFDEAWQTLIDTVISTPFGQWLTDLTMQFASTFNEIAINVGAKISEVVGFFTALPMRIGGAISGIWAQVVGYFMPIVSQVMAIVNTVVSFFAALPGRLGALIGSIGATVGAWFAGIPAAVGAVVDQIVAFFRGLPDRIMRAIGNIGQRVSNAIGIGNIKLPFTATGGMFNGAQARVIGEAGPEAVVPLSGPLSRVDPAVRELAAFARGMGGASSSTSTSTVTSGPGVIVEAGAITVMVPTDDGATAAGMMLDRLVATYSG